MALFFPGIKNIWLADDEPHLLAQITERVRMHIQEGLDSNLTQRRSMFF